MFQKIYLQENLALREPALNRGGWGGESAGFTSSIDLANWINAGIVSGDITAAGGGVTDGNKGSITVSGTGSTWTVNPNTISNAMLQNAPAFTFKGRQSGLGTPQDLTATQATAQLDAMVGANGTVVGTKGLVPQPAATDNTKFLRGDGTWQTVSGGGSGATTYAATVTGANAATKCFVTASGTGVTLTKLSASEWRVNVPAGVEVYAINTGLDSADNPGVGLNHAYFAFVYADAGSRIYNQQTNGLDAKLPIVRMVNLLNGVGTPISRTNEQQYDPTTGANNLIVRLSGCGSGNMEIKLDGFTNAAGTSNCQIIMIF